LQPEFKIRYQEAKLRLLASELLAQLPPKLLTALKKKYRLDLEAFNYDLMEPFNPLRPYYVRRQDERAAKKIVRVRRKRMKSNRTKTQEKL